MKNTATILGIVGGILGMIFSAVVIIAGIAMQFVGTIIPNQVDVPMNIHRLLPLFGNMAIARGIGALIFAIVGLIAGINVKKKHQLAGIFLLIAAIAGYIFLFIGFVVPGILFIIGGILALVSKEKLPETEETLRDQ
ncbi:MAG TPA: hypothetical protein DCY12_01120 [Candidatus Atribacteria bacterium]|nr:DUF4064 domain-containing protein [Candidatus Atribacteria bacterium]HAX97518.1 hypothetical protein [Candidatus Atribacteria bacterium]